MNERATHRAFDGLASTYEAHRPRYPAVIVDRLLDGVRRNSATVPLRALDVGCGTGISARALAERAVEVIAMDPGEDMLERARAACAASPTIRFMLGSAEHTGLPAAHVDLVLAAQAFHWFEPLRALEEFHRVLRPGGRCALLWNLRVRDGGFTDAYNDIVVSASTSIDPSTRCGREELALPLVRSSLFRDVQVVTAPSPQTLDEDGVVGRATSASYFPRQEPERSERLAALRAAFRQFAVNDVVTLQQDAQLTFATRA